MCDFDYCVECIKYDFQLGFEYFDSLSDAFDFYNSIPVHCVLAKRLLSFEDGDCSVLSESCVDFTFDDVN